MGSLGSLGPPFFDVSNRFNIFKSFFEKKQFRTVQNCSDASGGCGNCTSMEIAAGASCFCSQDLVTADKGGEVFGITRVGSEDFDRLQHYMFLNWCALTLQTISSVQSGIAGGMIASRTAVKLQWIRDRYELLISFNSFYQIATDLRLIPLLHRARATWKWLANTGVPVHIFCPGPSFSIWSSRDDQREKNERQNMWKQRYCI